MCRWRIIVGLPLLLVVAACAQSHGGSADGDVGGDAGSSPDASSQPCIPGDDVWHSETLDSVASTQGDILVDDRGVVHASWAGERGFVVAEQEGEGWRSEALADSSDWLYWSGLVLDAHGATHVSAIRGANIVHATNRSGAWVTEVVAEGVAGPMGIAIALDTNDLPKIAWSSDEGVAVASMTDSGWTAEAVPGASRSMFLALYVGGDVVRVADVTDRWMLELSTLGPEGWSVETIDEGPTYGRPRFTGTADGALRLAYHMDAPREVRSVVLAGDGGMARERIAAPAGLESALDFAFEPDGVLHVAEVTLDGVVHAEHRDGTWRTSVAAPRAEEMMGGVLPAVGSRPRSVHLLYSAFEPGGPNFLIPVPRHAWRKSECDREEWDGGVDDHNDAGAGGPTGCPRVDGAVRIDDGVNPEVVLAEDGTFTMTWGQIDWTRLSRHALSLQGAIGDESCVVESIGDGDPPILAGNSSGDVLAIRGNDFGPNRVWASFRPAGGDWGEPVEVSEPAGGWVTSAVLDGHGGASAVGVEEGAGTWAAHADLGSDWTAMSPASARPPDWTAAPAVAASERGGSIIAWIEGVAGGKDWLSSLWWASWEGFGWSEPAAATSDPFRGGEGTQLAVTDTGDAIATWFAIGPDGGDLRAASFDATTGGWGEATVLARTSGSAQSALALSPEGEAVLAWAGGSGVRVAGRDASGVWSAPEDLPGSSSPWSLDAVVAPDGQAVVVWSTPAGEQSATLWASRRDLGRWSDPIPVSETAGVLADRPRIALDPDGRALVAWHEIENPREYGPVSSVWAVVLP